MSYRYFIIVALIGFSFLLCSFVAHEVLVGSFSHMHLDTIFPKPMYLQRLKIFCLGYSTSGQMPIIAQYFISDYADFWPSKFTFFICIPIFLGFFLMILANSKLAESMGCIEMLFKWCRRLFCPIDKFDSPMMHCKYASFL